MGEIADALLDGTLCECCGVWLEGEAPGHPRYCSQQCRADRTPPLKVKLQRVKCKGCGKWISPVGMADHARVKRCKV